MTHPDSSGWKDLFDKDLSNAEYPAGGWRYESDGWLVPTQGEPIFTKKDYKSVVLDLVYVLPADANSGIFFYDSDHPKKKFEIQLLDDRSPVFKDVKPYQNTGSVYGRCAPSELRSKPLEGRVVKGSEGWLLSVHCSHSPAVVLNNGTVLPPPKVPVVCSHWHEYVNCCLEGGTPTSSFAWAARLTEMVVLGNEAMRKIRS